MEKWFQGDDPELDEWTRWAKMRESGFPVPGHPDVTRAFPDGFVAGGLREAIDFGLHSAHGTLFFCTLLSGSRLLLADPYDDESSFVASGVDAEGRCRVFGYNPRKLTLDTPGWSSIEAFLEDEELSSPTVDDSPLVDLSRRRSWLVGAFLGVGFASAEEDVRDAPSIDDYSPRMDRRRDVIYWLWHHAVAGNEDALNEMMSVHRESGDDWVRESVEWLDDHGHEWGEAFAALTPERVEELRMAMPVRCLQGERRPLGDEPSLEESDEFEAFEEWLTDSTRSQRERLTALIEEREEDLWELVDADAERLQKLLRKRINSPKLQDALAELLDELGIG